MNYKKGDMVRNTATNKSGVVLEVVYVGHFADVEVNAYKVEYANGQWVTSERDLEMNPGEEPCEPGLADFMGGDYPDYDFINQL